MTEYTPQSNEIFWGPEEGETFNDFMEYVKEEINDAGSLKIIRDNAFQILQRCNNPNSIVTTEEIARRTNLHLGEVQSGKTLAMCSAIALAYDNNFLITTVLTGTKNILKDQSNDRIRKILKNIDPNKEKFYFSSDSKADAQQVTSLLEKLKTNRKHSKPRMLIFTLLKHATSIENLYSLFNKTEVNKLEIGSLILDDEADQASLNTNAKRNISPSTTYSSLLKLRDIQPKFSTYIQVTATAQAQFCLSENDPLSPYFVSMSPTPKGYIGISTFFRRKEIQDSYVNIIPQEDIDNENEMPESLKEAINYFFVAVGLAKKLKLKGPFTFYCHPHSRQIEHTRYRNWIDKYIKSLQDDLLTEEKEDELFDRLKITFYNAISNLKHNENLDDINDIRQQIASTIERGPNISIVNEKNKPENLESFWDNANEHIIVGGTSIERGFTVNGILVTYMSRNPGSNSDTIQQRARFCGYKHENHLYLTRLWLDELNRRFFWTYLVTEEAIRRALEPHLLRPKPYLKAGFMIPLIPPYVPTRKNIIADDLNTDRITGWFSTKYAQFLTKNDSNYNMEYLGGKYLGDPYKFKRPTDKKWRCFISESFSVEDLLETLNNYKTCFSDDAPKNLISSILKSFPEEFKPDSPIFTCLLGDADILDYENPGRLIDAHPLNENKHPLIQRRGIKLKDDQDEQSIKLDDVNLRRGYTKNYCSDDDIAHKSLITMQIGLYKFNINNETKYKDSNKRHKEIFDRFSPGPTICIRLKFPELGSWRSFRR